MLLKGKQSLSILGALGQLFVALDVRWKERSVALLNPQRKVSRDPRGSAAMTAVLRCLHSYLATQPPDHQSPLSVSVIPPILAPRPVKRTTPSRPVNTASSSCTVSPPARPPSRTERRFACAHAGCEKAYFKPSRLAEHALTHTGVVRFFPIDPSVVLIDYDTEAASMPELRADVHSRISSARPPPNASAGGSEEFRVHPGRMREEILDGFSPEETRGNA